VVVWAHVAAQAPPLLLKIAARIPPRQRCRGRMICVMHHTARASHIPTKARLPIAARFKRALQLPSSPPYPGRGLEAHGTAHAYSGVRLCSLSPAPKMPACRHTRHTHAWSPCAREYAAPVTTPCARPTLKRANEPTSQRVTSPRKAAKYPCSTNANASKQRRCTSNALFTLKRRQILRTIPTMITQAHLSLVPGDRREPLPLSSPLLPRASRWPSRSFRSRLAIGEKQNACSPFTPLNHSHESATAAPRQHAGSHRGLATLRIPVPVSAPIRLSVLTLVAGASCRLPRFTGALTYCRTRLSMTSISRSEIMRLEMRR
jgi:hypothetical protein